MTPIYLTRADLNLTRITSVDILPGGVIFVCFSHEWYGSAFTAILKFHIYIGGQDDRWNVTMAVYPKDDVMVGVDLENVIKLNLVTIFSPFMKKNMRSQRWTS